MSFRVVVATTCLLAIAVVTSHAQNRNLQAERLVLDDDAGDGGFNTLTLQVPAAGLSANRTLIFPDADGTVVTGAPGGLVANQILFGGPSGQAAQSASLVWNPGSTLFNVGAGSFTVDGSTGNVDASGNLQVDGTTTLGDADADATTARGTINLNTTNAAAAVVNVNTTAFANTTTVGNNTAGNTLQVNSPVINAPNLPAGTASDDIVTTDGAQLFSTDASTLLEDDAWLIGGNSLTGASTTRFMGISAQAGSEDHLGFIVDGNEELRINGSTGLVRVLDGLFRSGGGGSPGQVQIVEAAGNFAMSVQVDNLGGVDRVARIPSTGVASSYFIMQDRGTGQQINTALDVSGDLDVGTGNFTVASGTGNTSIGGTATVSGVLDAQTSGNTVGDGTNAVQLQISGTAGSGAFELDVDGDADISGNAVVNGVLTSVGAFDALDVGNTIGDGTNSVQLQIDGVGGGGAFELDLNGDADVSGNVVVNGVLTSVGAFDALDAGNTIGDATDAEQLQIDGVDGGVIDVDVNGDMDVSGTLTAGTLGLGFSQGSVPFADGSGNLVEDNANLFWDNTNDRLGIGNSAPSVALDVTGNIEATGTIQSGASIIIDGTTPGNHSITTTGAEDLTVAPGGGDLGITGNANVSGAMTVSSTITGSSSGHSLGTASTDANVLTIEGLNNGASTELQVNGDLDVTGTLSTVGFTSGGGGFTLSGDLDVNGNDIVDGTDTDVTIGDDLSVTGDVVPDADNTYSLGTTALRWANVFVNGGSVHIGDQNGIGTDEMVLGYNGTTTGTIGVNGTTALSLTTTDATFSGGVNVGGALDVTGNTTMNGTVALGDAAGDQITSNGNLDALNGIDITGANLTVGGANFFVSVANGNTSVGGTFSVTGESTFSDQITGNSDVQLTSGDFLAVAGGVTVANNVDGGGDLIIDGDATLGDAAADAVTINGQIASDIVPDGDATRDLGSSTNRWDELFVSGPTIHIGADANEAQISFNAASGLEFDGDDDGASDLTIDEATGNVSIAGDLGVTGTLTTATTAAQGDALIASINNGTNTINATRIGNGLTDTQVDDDLTISGGAVDNTAIGATTPSTGAFTNLTTTGTTTLGDGTGTDNVTIDAEDGSVGISGSPAAGSLVTINEDGTNTPNLLSLEIGGTAEVVVNNGGRILLNGATGVSNSRLIMNNSHVTSQQTTAPTAAGDGTNLQTAVTVLGNSTDVAGHVEATDGGAAGTGVITVTFNANYGGASNPIVVVTPGNAAAAGTGFYVSNIAAGSFDINVATTAGDNTTTYEYYYHVIEAD